MTTPQENQPGEAAQDLDRSEAVAVGASSETATLIASITEYLSLGGLFNPEMMNHNAVRDLLINCRTQLAAERVKRLELEQELFEARQAILREGLRSAGIERERDELRACLNGRDAIQDPMEARILQLEAELLALRGGEGRKVSDAVIMWLKHWNVTATNAQQTEQSRRTIKMTNELLCVLSEEGGRQKEGWGEATGRPVDGASDLNPQNESDL